MQLFHFGSSRSPLFGAYHPPRSGRARLGVLLCPSIGPEYLRTHWATRRLADQLSRAGLAAFRFDYHGLGDSSQNVADIHSLAAWQQDAAEAAEELQNQSGCDSVVIVGLRFGALIAKLVDQHLPASHPIILWEPALDGSLLLRSWRSMHQQMLDLWPRPIKTPAAAGCEELLGTLYRHELLAEIESLRFCPDDFGTRSCHVVGQSMDGKPRMPSAVLTSASSQDQGDWNDLRYIEIAWLPVAGPALIVELLRTPLATANPNHFTLELTVHPVSEIAK